VARWALAVITIGLLSPPSAWAGDTYRVLHAFNGGLDGGGIYDPVAFDSEGNLYGTTWGSGAHGNGTVFKLTPSANGRWAKVVLYNFCALPHCLDGALPLAGLALDTAGNIYGATSTGGAGDVGTIFELSPNSASPSGLTYSVLYEPGSDVGLILDRTREKTEEWVREVSKLNDRHLSPEQIVEEIRRKITDETGIPLAAFPSYVNVMIRASVLGILAYLDRASSAPSAPKT